MLTYLYRIRKKGHVYGDSSPLDELLTSSVLIRVAVEAWFVPCVEGDAGEDRMGKFDPLISLHLQLEHLNF